LSSIIAQLTRELNNRLSKSEIDNLLHQEMELLVESLENTLANGNVTEREDISIVGTIHGVRMMAKQFHDALAQELN